MKKLFLIPIMAVLSLNGYGAAPVSGAAAGANLLEQTSQAFTQIAEKAMPATVFIKSEIAPAQGQMDQINPFDMFGDDFFRRFFGGQQPFNQLQPQQPQPQISGGSGFLITTDGYVVTNNHVIKDATSITVILNDGREYPASVKGADPRTDLAVLKIEEKNLPFLTFGDSDGLKIGEWVVAIGNPFGIGATLTAGIVSAKGRQDLGIASYEDFIQTDAAINPGNSGGPLFNLQGRVIGVNTAIYTRSGGYMGIGLSIPSKMAQNVIDQILESGVIKRAYLGIVLQPVDKDLASALELDQEGVLISEVVKGSPAAKAGLQQGDIILQYNGKAVKSVAKLRTEIAMMNPGSDIKLDIIRDNKKSSITAFLGSLDGEVMSAELIQKLGIDIENLTPETAARLGYNGAIDGIAISRVKPGSPAALAGLRPGFLITGIAATNLNNAKSVKNTADFEEAMKDLGDKKHIILIVRQQNFQRYYTVKMN